MAIHAHFTGRLTRNAELKTAGQNEVLKFSVATNHGYGDKKQTLYVNCDVWGKRGATLANYLNKGSEVVIHGELYTREYTAKDGTTKSSLECRVNELDLVGGKKEKSEESGNYEAKANGGGGADFDDSMPFASVGNFQQ